MAAEEGICYTRAVKDKDCTVLVTSCDGYSDVAAPFIVLFRRYWPDCPFETVLLTETVAPPAGDAAFDRVIATGKGKCWCEMLAEALEQISTPYVILQMDDFYFSTQVDTANILRRLAQAKEFDAANLRLVPLPPGRTPFPGTDLREMPKDVAYCVTCQTGIWNREFLLGLARRNKSAWEFERYGSFMVGDERRVLLVTPSKEYPVLDTVHKGYWEPCGVRVLKENGIPYDFSRRGQPPLPVRVKEGLKKLVFAIFPWTLIVRVQNVFNAGMKEKRKE